MNLLESFSNTSVVFFIYVSMEMISFHSSVTFPLKTSLPSCLIHQGLVEINPELSNRAC